LKNKVGNGNTGNKTREEAIVDKQLMGFS